MAQDVYTTQPTAGYSQGRTRKIVTRKSCVRFQPLAPLNLCMDILGPLLKTNYSNQHVLVFFVRYTNLTRAIPVATVALTNAATVSADNWVIRYGIPT